MMQMLGLRGTGPSKQETEVVQASSSTTRHPAKALRLVYCDERGKFKMDAEAVAALQFVKGPLGVVSVCGRARQGKSFILNQLLGRSGGFQVASTHRPCTKGLWMWSTPLNRAAPDGTEYSLLLLDSEGIDAYDQTGTYSTQIFSLAVLLSSMFVYNQMGGIDEAALDRLSLVTEMTKHIRVRASETRASAAELGQFSPIFLWLLRDFYLDLTEDGQRITPREYLEFALQPMPGSGKAIAAKNEIRESIRALFPERDCFTLVRPINSERDLQQLDQIPLKSMRPEFRTGLDALTRFIFERTRPKQLGSTVLTGPLLAGLTQSFLDAINAGAVPTIATSWQNVEENECRRANDMAMEAYSTSFNKCATADEEAHEGAVQNALGVYNSEAVGAGTARHKYEKLLLMALKKQFEEYRRKVSMEAELKCMKAVETVDDKFRAACHSPGATFDHMLQVLNGLVLEYEESTFGPTKWKKLVKFLQQSLDGPLSDLSKKWSDQSAAENVTFQLKCRSLEDRLVLLGKQLDSTQKDAVDWKRRYEAVVADYNLSSEESATRYAGLQNKYSTLEERCETLFQQLGDARKEAVERRNKYEQTLSEWRIEEEHILSETAALQSRCSAAEARLAAAREQSEAAKEEALEWKRKHDVVMEESCAEVEKARAMHDLANKQAQIREDKLRAEFLSTIADKEKQLRDLHDKVEQGKLQTSTLNIYLKDQELKLNVQEEELSALRTELRHLQTAANTAKAACQSAEWELGIIQQEKARDEERLNAELRMLESTEERCRIAEREAKRASEVAERAHDEATLTQTEKLEAEKLAIERLAAIERTERHAEVLLREKEDLAEEIIRVQCAEQVAISRAGSLERRLETREKEIEELLQSAQEQRANTVEVLESLLATERQAHAEANARAEALSLKLQAMQGKVDALQHQLTGVRLNETALDSKLKALHTETQAGLDMSCTKRSRANDYEYNELLQDMELDTSNGSLKKRSRIVNTENRSSPAHGLVEGNSSIRHDENGLNDWKETQDYSKFTISKLKQELTNAGFAAELLQLRNPTKKDILSLYEKLVLQK